MKMLACLVPSWSVSPSGQTTDRFVVPLEIHTKVLQQSPTSKTKALSFAWSIAKTVVLKNKLLEACWNKLETDVCKQVKTIKPKLSLAYGP